MDRDSKFCHGFRKLLKGEGAEPVQLPPRSPNLNSYIERFFRSLKSEALSRIVFFGEASLRRTVKEYLAHYHRERNHQGVDNKLIEPSDEVGTTAGDIKYSERLGGLLKYYYCDPDDDRKAA